MNNEKNKKIEEILDSLDANQGASAPDFFYTRLKARMIREEGERTPWVWVLRPAYALAALIVVMIINVSIILKGETKTENSTSDSETAQSIAAEYSLNDNISLYDLTQEK